MTHQSQVESCPRHRRCAEHRPPPGGGGGPLACGRVLSPLPALACQDSRVRRLKRFDSQGVAGRSVAAVLAVAPEASCSQPRRGPLGAPRRWPERQGRGEGCLRR